MISDKKLFKNYAYTSVFCLVSSCGTAKLEKEEQSKAERDLLLYGQAFIVDGKHIPLFQIGVPK